MQVFKQVNNVVKLTFQAN